MNGPNTSAALFEQIQRSFYVRAAGKDTPLPMASPHHRGGVIVPVYGDWDRATVRAKELSSKYGHEAHPQAITPFWDTLRRFAQLGFDGVMLDETHPVHFFNRVAEPDRALPSVARLRHLATDDDECSQTVIGQVLFGPGGPIEEGEPIISWADYSRLDRTSVRWMLGADPLPESPLPWTIDAGIPGGVSFMSSETLLGPYVADAGIIPIFGSEALAEYFALVRGLYEVQAGRPIPRPRQECRIRPVEQQLVEFLDDISAYHGPTVDISLNPGCHRYRQGYFFKTVEHGWCLRTLSGVFGVGRGGELISLQDVEPPKGDTVGRGWADQSEFSGVTSVANLPFARFFGANRGRVGTDEARVRLKSDYQQRKPDYTHGKVMFGPDAYALDGFDKITGDTLSSSLIGVVDGEWGGPLVFADFADACNWLMTSVLPHDERVRTRGGKLCHGGGVTGSGDPRRERRMTKAVRKAIVRIARDALTTGYRPEHSVQLQRLFQDTSATLEITLAGYLADLAYFGLPDGAFGKRIESAVAKEETEFGRMFAELQRSPLSRAQVNPVLTERLKDLLGSATDLLTPKSITILTTALDQYQRVGRRPDYDYAGISMKLCKVVERELRGRVFVSLRSEFDGDAGRPRLDSLRIASRGVNDRNGDKLLKWLSSEDATRVTRTCCFRVEYDASESSDGLD